MRTYLTIASIILFIISILFFTTLFWCRGGSVSCWLLPRGKITGGDSLFYGFICLVLSIILIMRLTEKVFFDEFNSFKVSEYKTFFSK